MWTKWIICVVIVLFNSLAFAADPASISVQSGTFYHKNAVVITGINFGANSLNWSATNDNIEDGTTDAVFSPPSGWLVDAASSTNIQPTYSDADSHSGSQSILSHPYGAGGVGYNSGYRYVTGTTPSSVYVTWYVKLIDQSGASGWQWKEIKWGCGATSHVDDNYTCIWSSQWKANSSYVLYDDTCDANYTLDQTNWHTDLNQWTRYEWYFEAGASSAVIFTTYKNETTTVEHVNVVVDICSDGHQFIWQNFFGNLSGGFRDALIYQDDHFIQYNNGQARIEIGNASTWANCTHKEIQHPTIWSDTGATFTVNAGSFADETAYLYVVNSDGEVNASGIEISIGGGSEPPTIRSISANLKEFILTGSEDLVITNLDDGDFKASGSVTGSDIDLENCTEDVGVITCTSAQTFNNYETITISFYGGADEVESAGTGADLEVFSGKPVANNTEAPFLKGTGGIVNGSLN